LFLNIRLDEPNFKFTKPSTGKKYKKKITEKKKKRKLEEPARDASTSTEELKLKPRKKSDRA
jgi:hypothetical protein